MLIQSRTRIQKDSVGAPCMVTQALVSSLTTMSSLPQFSFELLPSSFCMNSNGHISFCLTHPSEMLPQLSWTPSRISLTSLTPPHPISCWCSTSPSTSPTVLAEAPERHPQQETHTTQQHTLPFTNALTDLLDAFSHLTHLSLLAPLLDTHHDKGSEADLCPRRSRNDSNAAGSESGEVGWLGGALGVPFSGMPGLSQGRSRGSRDGAKGEGTETRDGRGTKRIGDGVDDLPLIPLALHRLPRTLQVRLMVNC